MVLNISIDSNKDCDKNKSGIIITDYSASLFLELSI